MDEQGGLLLVRHRQLRRPGPRRLQDGAVRERERAVVPVPNLFVGPEVQYINRTNFDDFTSDDFRVQLSAKYSFSPNFGGK